MGKTMGHHRKGEDRGSVDRPGPRNARIRRGKKTPPRTRNKGPKSSGGKVIPLRGQRWASGATRARRASSMAPEARTTVGHISLTEDASYRAFAEEQAGGTTQVAAPTRGSIVSADGRELATSLEVARVIATPYQIADPGATARELHALLKEETDTTEKEIRTSLMRRGADGQLSGYSVVATGVEPETAAKVQGLGIEGITTTPDTMRVYPDGSLASQLLGNQGDYGETFGGVEASHDETLKGGRDVHLTVDSAVQQELQKALAKAVEKSKAKSAVGVVMRADDGAILALANTPAYDNNEFGDVPAEDQRDRVLTDPYEPGSTFKAFTVASALEDGAVTPSSKFVVPDHMVVADHVINDSRPHATEVMTPAEVLENSSNVGATKIAKELGGKELYVYIRAFGFGEPTGVDLWGEDL